MTNRKLPTKVRVEESGNEDEEEFEDSREDLPPRDPVGLSSAQEQAPPLPSTSTHPGNQLGFGHGSQREGHLEGVLDQENLIEDAKFYQDAALDYQNAYQALHAQQVKLQGKYSTQASLIEEASAAIKAAEAEAQHRHQELLDVQHSHQAEIKAAVSRAIEQYKVQLSTAQSSMQSKDHEHQRVIQKLQSKIQSLEVSSASQVNLPSVGVSHTQDGPGLCSEVFNFIPGTVNKQHGAAWYDSQDQAILFHKQVWFKDRTSSPDLDHNTSISQLPKHLLHIAVLLISITCLISVKYHHSHLVINKMLPHFWQRFLLQLWQKHQRSFAICLSLKLPSSRGDIQQMWN